MLLKGRVGGAYWLIEYIGKYVCMYVGTEKCLVYYVSRNLCTPLKERRKAGAGGEGGGLLCM